jgi:curli biogenesis system outer membrane secretion channel CsgG
MNRVGAFSIVAGMLITGSLGAVASGQGEWKASYLTHPKKPESRTGVEGDPGRLEDKHWLTIEYSAYPGYQPSLALISEKTEKAEKLPEAETEIGKVMRDLARFSRSDEEKGPRQDFSPEAMAPEARQIVRAALGETKRFRVVDRDVALGFALEEQDFGQTGRVSKRSAAKTGKVRGASYGVRVSVIETNPEKDVKEIKAGAGIIGMAGGALGGIAVGGKVAFCRLNVMVIDVETGDIIFDTMVDGTASEKTRDFGAVMGGVISRKVPLIGGIGGRKKDKTGVILTDAITACAAKAAYHIATQMEDRPFETSVARVDGARVTIVGGSDAGMRAGMELDLLSRGEPITDPATGDTLEWDAKAIGKVRVGEVRERTSSCEIVEGGQGAKVGDIVRYAQARKE